VGAIFDVLGDDFPVAAETRRAMEWAAATGQVSVMPCCLALADPFDLRDPILPLVLPDPVEAASDGGNW